jgi:PhzF family phenazine biosynthesis protein
MKIRPFKQVDVFTDTAYLGNPLAVVLDGSDLSSEDMQHFAQWTNLSETTFLLPPTPEAAAQGADYRLRIFTPGGELPFAGHPTLGSCHAWLQAGGQSQSTQHIVQECAKGLVTIHQNGSRLAFAAPSMRRDTPSPDLLASVATALQIRPHQIIAAQLLDNGSQWLGLLLDSEETVLALKPNHMSLKDLGQKVGVAHINTSQATTTLIARSNREARAFAPRTRATESIEALAQVQVRAFAAPIGVNEDPVTGSLNAALAQWLISDGLAPTRYIATQGTCLGRHGQVYIDCDASQQVWVGGDVVTCIEGSVTL